MCMLFLFCKVFRIKGGDLDVLFRIFQFILVVDMAIINDSHVFFYDEKVEEPHEVRIWFKSQRRKSFQLIRFCN